MLPRLWGDGKLSSIDDKTLSYLKGLGVEWLWLTGMPRHASGKDFVKGNPGSPYAISDWKDLNPYLADNPARRIEEFRSLVKRIHDAGLYCMVDFIPNHVARDYVGDLPHHQYCDYDWTDTFKIDWSSGQTVNSAVGILRFWAELGADGFRCDMVELVPAGALKETIAAIKAEFPDLLFVAEAYMQENYRTYLQYAGFDLLYDKSGTYDILRSLVRTEPGNADAGALSRNWQFLSDLQPCMLNFLENHDEQRTASDYYAGDGSRSCWAALCFSLLFNTASFMLYFGQEAGENAAEGHEGRTSIFNWSNPATIGRLWRHIESGSGLNDAESAILARYRSILALAGEKVFKEGLNWDLCYCQQPGSGFDSKRHFAFLRYCEGNARVVFCNFSDRAAQTEILIPEEPLGRSVTVQMTAEAGDYSIISLDNILASKPVDTP